MAKVPFTKLKCTINNNMVSIPYGDDLIIEVKQYLPIQEKLALIGRVVAYAHSQDANYSNPVKAAALRDLEIVFTYSNISFTDKQKENLPKLYDQLYSSGVLDTILSNIPSTEYCIIKQGVEDSITAIYAYVNSIVGVMDAITANREEAGVDLATIQDGIQSLQNSSFLSEILPLLGLDSSIEDSENL